MHLRTKLTLGILAATLVTFLAVGFVAIPAAKRALRDRIDDRLLADIGGVREAMLGADGDPRGGSEPGGRTGEGDYAVVLLDGSTMSVLATSGPRADPDPPPDVADIELLPTGDDVAYAEAADGAVYRVATVDVGDGRVLAVAAPVDDLSALVDELIGTFTVIAVVAGAALAVVSWWWIRRTTRPIEQLTRRADAITTGDPDRRLAVPSRTTELRRLTHALDTMIASVDASLAVRSRSEARLREFIANASHELRTPLTSVSGYLQLDVDGALADPDQHRRSMGRALAEASRMHRLVADMQLLTELDEDAAWVPADVDVARLVREAVHDASTIDSTRAWTVHAPDEPLVVRAYADQLRQVIGNLLGNIRTHTPPGTTATIRLGRDDERGVVLEVTDDGPGLPADELARAFDRFWRHDPSRSRASGGSGLGLSIVDAIITAHRGTTAASHSEHGGLTIRITLPTDRAATPPAPAELVHPTRGHRPSR